MEQAPDPVFHHGKFIVDSSGLDDTLRPKYDYVLEEMAKADGISLFHAHLRTSPDDEWLVVNSHCFDFAFQFKMKYFRTLTALMQADGIPLSTQLRFSAKQCRSVQHKQFIDPDIEWISSESGALVPRAAGGAENGEDAWVDVAEELEKTEGVEHQASPHSRVASLDQNQKLAYMDLVYEICEKERIYCNIGEDPVETGQIDLLRAIWGEDLAQVLSAYQYLKDSDDPIPLHAALLESIKAQRLKLVEFFLDEGAIFTQTRPEDSVIWSHQSPELYEVLLRRNWHDLKTNTVFLDKCLIEACRDSGPDVVQYLMRKGARPKKASWIADTSTLALAVRSKEVLDYVLFKGEMEPEIGHYDRDAVAMTIQGSGAMQVAALLPDIDVVRTLLRWGGDVNEVPPWDLVGDAREPHNGPGLHKILCQMAYRFGSVESQESHDKRMEKYFEMIVFLLENGADPNIRNQSGLNAWRLLEQVSNANKARVAEIMKPYRPREADISADSTV